MANQTDPKVVLDVFLEKTQAFRSTLNAQEQAILDQMVAAVAVDVMSHGMSQGAMPDFAVHAAAVSAFPNQAVVNLKAAAAMENAQEGIDDVEAHALQSKLESTWAFKVAADGAYSVEAVPAEPAISNERLGDGV